MPHGYNPTATALAIQFHNAYETQAPQFGYETRKDTRTFDMNSPNGKLMTATCEELLRSGVVVMPRGQGETVLLTGVKDGRRARKTYPDHLSGWQFLGQLDENGKPFKAPRWVSERISLQNGHAVFKTTDSIVLKDLVTGDWIVRDNASLSSGSPRIWAMSAAGVARWYGQY